MKAQKTTDSQNNLKKVGGTMLPDFKLYYISMILTQNQTHGSEEQNTEPRKEPTLTWTTDL